MSGFDGMVSLRPALGVERAPDATLGEVASATLEETLASNPSVAYYREKYLEKAGELSPDTVDAVSARQRLKEEGLEGRLRIPDQGIPRFALDTLIDRKREEVKREEVLSRAPPGIASGSVRLAVGLGASLLDPLNIAAGFFPVVGEARYARLLSKAPGFLGRTAVRAGVGAVEGTAGTAAIEAIVYSSKQADQADYDMADSLANIAFGGVFGAGLHVMGGALGEVARALRGGAADVAANVSPDTRAAALKTAVAQAAQGEPVNVEPLIRLDPAAENTIPRAENLTPAERAIETRFARQIGGDIETAMADYARLPDSEGGRVLNTDLARELSADYRADRTRSAAVHEPASALVKEMYARRLAEAPSEGQTPLVVFTAGGTGAGKSTAIAALSDSSEALRHAQIVYDTNLNSLKSSVQKIEQALNAGKAVRVMYVQRDAVDALTNGALPRAMRMGRTVPLVEHARTHAGSAAVIRELAERYRDNPRVDIQLIDNTRGKGQVRIGSIDQIRPMEYNALVGNLHAALEAERQAGRISEAVYRGTLGDFNPDSGLQVGGGVSRGGQEAGPGYGGEPEQAGTRRPIDLAAVRDAARDPKLSSLADEGAAGAADERLAETQAIDDLARVQQETDEELLRLKESGIDAAEELEPYDAAVKDAQALGRAARAAVVCGLRHAS